MRLRRRDLTRPVRQIDQRLARRPRVEYGAGKVDARGLTLATQIDAFGVDPCHPPVRARAPHKPFREERDRLDMVSIHVLDDLPLGCCERDELTGKAQLRSLDPRNSA